MAHCKDAVMIDIVESKVQGGNGNDTSLAEMHLAVAELFIIVGALPGIISAQMQPPVTTSLVPSSNRAQKKRCSQASAVIAQASTTISNTPGHISCAHQILTKRGSSSANFALGIL